MKRLCTIDFDIREEPAIEMEVDAVSVVNITGVDEYDGEYTVIPKLEPQTLPTKDRVLREDVSVTEIPITVTANTAGGNTIVIGG